MERLRNMEEKWKSIKNIRLGSGGTLCQSHGLEGRGGQIFVNSKRLGGFAGQKLQSV